MDVITYERAIDIIVAMRKKEVIHDFGEIKVLNGRYGAYIHADNKNYKIPQGVDVNTLTKEKCSEIMSNPDNASKGSSAKRSWKIRK